MSDKLIPADAHLAAKRGFIRTTTQALAATIPTMGIGGAALSGADWRVIAWAVAAAVLSSLLAGAASYLSLLSKGIPEDYAPQVPPRDAETGAVELPDADVRYRGEPVAPRDPDGKQDGRGGYLTGQ